MWWKPSWVPASDYTVIIELVQFSSPSSRWFTPTFYFVNFIMKIYRVVHSNWPVRVLNKFSIYKVATEACNTAMEREFSWLFDDTFENCENLSYETEFSFFWQVAELTNKLIYPVLVNLRSTSSIWKLPWSMTINTRPIQLHYPQTSIDNWGRKAKYFLLKQNQVYAKMASKQTEDKKYLCNMVFGWEWTNMWL